MKVVGVICSPRKGSNSEIIIEEVLAGAREYGADTELIALAGKEIKPCDGCWACSKAGKCHINDDMQPIYEKLEEADGLVFGSPVYHYSLNGLSKDFIDRMSAMTHPSSRLINKVGGAIVVAARQGHIVSLHTWMHFILSCHMFPGDMFEAFGNERGEIRRDERAMKCAWEMGRRMVELVKIGFKYPPGYDTPLYVQVMERYKVPRLPRG